MDKLAAAGGIFGFLVLRSDQDCARIRHEVLEQSDSHDEGADILDWYDPPDHQHGGWRPCRLVTRGRGKFDGVDPVGDDTKLVMRRAVGTLIGLIGAVLRRDDIRNRIAYA